MTVRVRQPILRLDVVASDGTSTSEHRVFCRMQHRSSSVEDCCACVRCDAVTDGVIPAVECSIPEPPLGHRDDPRGENVEVGALLCQGTAVLGESASVGRALGVLRDQDRRSVAIVGENRVLVGIMHEASVLGRMRPARRGSVSAAMSTAVAVHERTPVRTAVKLLAANHLREITVVSSAGVPIGVFRDIDGLAWLASAREGGHQEPEE